MRVSTDELWARVDELIGAAPGARALTVHRLEPLAARRLRALGRDVPDEAAESERLGAAFALAAEAHLARARAAVEGPLLIVKGPEVAALYPDPATRVSRDVDLVVPDPGNAQRRLLAAGFAEAGSAEYYAEAAHLVPLAWPGLPVEVEVHGRPNWPPWLVAPSAEALLEGAVPSAVGVEGLLAPSPERHALVLAAHAWTHGPLTRLRDLLDVALVTARTNREEIEQLADDWGMGRLWRTTDAIATALFVGGPQPRPLRTWARNLSEARERTVLEQHVARWVGWHAALPRRLAVRATLDELRDDLTPERGETWGSKARRSGRAVRHAFVPRSKHERGAED
jgi:Uncharacterised nucleotidyltransferase